MLQEGDLTPAETDGASSVPAVTQTRAGGGSATSVNLYAWIHHAHCSVTNGESSESRSSTSLSSLVLRPHDERNEHDLEKSLTVVDEGSGLLITVAFSELVRIKQILITSATGEERIDRCKVWSNQIDPPDLEEAEDNDPKPDQEFQLLAGERECVEYPVRVARFASVSTVTVYLVSSRLLAIHILAQTNALRLSQQSSYRPAQQRLFYLGFKGESHTHKKASEDDIAVGAHNAAPSTVPGMKEKYGSAHQVIH